MEKPTIFLSHSSSDKEYISKLNSIITKRTSKTVEIFQSSDGASIPFGNNWVHKIEENLQKAKIMLVFVSPKSATSSWIYFESGFAYSKGVRVIPIGIAGIDIGALKPPLNLLQGFNINDENGLGNLITVINREFQTEFDEKFTAADYRELSSFDPTHANKEASKKIDKISITLYKKVGNSSNNVGTAILSDCMDRIQSFLTTNQIKFHTSNNGLSGAKQEISSHGIKIKQDSEGSVHVSISLDSLFMYEGLINELPNLYETPLDRGWMHIIPTEESKLITDDIKLSSKLHKHGYPLSEIGHGFYSKESWNIKTFNKNESTVKYSDSILINYPKGTFNSNALFEIINEMISAEIIS
nr:toll/interleukin-1 receptor domain-containing protein [uncultured Pseudomonas sp.]